MTAPTLTGFLLARIAEDEAGARAAEGGADWWAFHLNGVKTREEPKWIIDSNPRLISYEVTTEGSAHHIGAWSPARVLAECEAKRHIVEDYASQDAGSYEPGYAGRKSDMIFGQSIALERAVRAHAAVYADHPDYDEAWRP